MSADLLRRAAETLRDKANAVDVDCSRDEYVDWQLGGLGGEPGDLGALMHPGVALALADWLDGVATYMSGNGMHCDCFGGLAVARVILGEQVDPMSATVVTVPTGVLENVLVYVRHWQEGCSGVECQACTDADILDAYLAPTRTCRRCGYVGQMRVWVERDLCSGCAS